MSISPNLRASLEAVIYCADHGGYVHGNGGTYVVVAPLTKQVCFVNALSGDTTLMCEVESADYLAHPDNVAHSAPDIAYALRQWLAMG